MNEKKRRIGIMGGTFDPIHLGHLAVAENVREMCHLDHVLFIPSANPPHKRGHRLAAARHRYAMTLLAICSNPYFSISSLEMDRPGLSYAVDTVQELLRIYGQETSFYFITGADAIKEVPDWERVDELLSICHFVAAARPGPAPDFAHLWRRFGAIGREHIHCLTTPELDISSTDIRARVHQGLSIKYIVPESVVQYIYKEGLYNAEEDAPQF